MIVLQPIVHRKLLVVSLNSWLLHICQVSTYPCVYHYSYIFVDILSRFQVPNNLVRSSFNLSSCSCCSYKFFNILRFRSKNVGSNSVGTLKVSLYILKSLFDFNVIYIFKHLTWFLGNSVLLLYSFSIIKIIN